MQTKTFATKKAAELWAAGIEARMGVSEFDPLQLKQATVTTCATIFERYLAEVVPDMKGRNEKNIVARLIRHAVSRFKGADKQRDKRWSDTDIKTFLAASGHKEDVIPKTGREYVGWALV